ncbi:unnamed protein product [Darwinula stevensoni]|uniref:Elongation of very long chain fatty acids protein n=1 Tax=Darwinula stevensoni TaxID=69355 RepID=A0A7R8XDU1_9CRUS|nr:unnamed protein product [Darwinula stevensoni]CAG0887156.1 unnamed protein product [Darwinula stevensoni]
MNPVVHSIMYYTASTLGVKVGGGVAMCITTLKILQMVVGSTVSLSAGFYKLLGLSCRVSDGVVTMALLGYFSYFALFVDFFRNGYLNKSIKLAKKTP